MEPTSRISGAWLLALAAATAGCEGVIRDGSAGPHPRDVSDPASPDPLGRSREGMSVGPFHDALGLRRLTRFEYSNTVDALLAVPNGGAALPDDLRLASFTNNVHGLKPSLGLVQALAQSAEQVSAAALPKLALPTGCALATLTDDCFARFLGPWLTGAFRRAPTAEETQRLTALFGALAQTAPRSEALRGVVEAVLMSPSFLYRTEAADTLGPYELASRLSYVLWASMPDAELLQAAARGELATAQGRVAQLERMWGDPRTKTGLGRFAAEWLGVEPAALSRKNAEVRAGAPATLEADLELELATLVERQLLERDASLEQFLAGKTTYVTGALAAHYGLPSAGEGLQAVSLEGTPRRGALTSGLVIASHAKESGYSVPQLGKFLRQGVLCQVVPAPPADAVNERAMPAPGQTYREAFTGLTEGRATCRACHEFINPPGFAYLAFDPLGRHLASDPDGRPIDTATRFPRLDGETVDVSGPAELAEKVGASGRALDCLTRMTIEYAMGRTLAAGDLALYEEVASSLPPRAGLYAVLARVVASDAFTRRGATP